MNNNIEESYCSFQVSKLLKEKGFFSSDDELIRRGWVHAPNEGWSFTSFGQEQFDEYEDWFLCRRAIGGYVLPEDYPNFYAAPTHALAIEWLRVNYGIWIQINGWKKCYRGFVDGDAMNDTTKIKLDLEYLQVANYKWALQPDSIFKTPQAATEATLLFTLQKLP